MNTNKRIVIAGGSGFLGLNLARYLAKEDTEIIILSRHTSTHDERWRFITWDGRTVDNWITCLDGATAIINLAGRSVDCIKTPDHMDEILRSRVESTQVLGKALRLIAKPPPVWVQMSTAHLYGDSLSCICDEDSAFGFGFAPFVGEAWEAAFQQAILPNMRQVILRTTFVLGQHGGALKRLVALVRWGLGGKVGHGQQGISWIHEQDLNQIISRAISDETMSGAYLATAPNPVNNAVFMKTLRKALRVPIGLPALSCMVKIGAPLVMKTDPELALYGRFCVSRRLKEEKYDFLYPELKGALDNLFNES